MFRVAICDDNAHDAKMVASMLEVYSSARPDAGLECFIFTGGEALVEAIDAGQAFEVLLLDIVMPALDGMTLAKTLRTRKIDIPLVFLTSSADFALAAFSVQATQYLLKPVQQDALFAALDGVLSLKNRVQEKFFMLTTPERSVKLQHASIVCVESFRRTLLFHLENGETLVSKTIRAPIASAVAPLMADSRFLHAHKSYIINMEHVEQITSASFKMKNDIEVFVPRYKYAEAKANYLAYLSGSGVGRLGGAQ